MVDIEAIEQPQNLQPALGIDLNLVPGLDKQDITLDWSKDGLPFLATDNPLYSFANPFVIKEENRIELYQPGAYWLNWANTQFGTQFYVPPVEPGAYRVDVNVNNAYEKSIEIPVESTP